MLERGAQVLESGVNHGVATLSDMVGGQARLRVVVLLAAVLGISSADTGAISALAPKLEASLHIGNLDIGLLVTVSGLTAALGVMPAGWLTDRWCRTRLVTGAVCLWGVAELASAFSPDYRFLLIVRLLLGVMTAVTGPTLASLTGDFFPARERSQIYGYILSGELLGAGFGLVLASLFSSWFSWRVGFGVLAVPSLVLAWELHRRLPEPARGGQSRLERGAETITVVDDGHIDNASPALSTPGTTEMIPEPDRSEILAEVRRRGIDPRHGVVLERDPLALGLWESVRYVVAVRSDVILIVASALGYFFFSGVETFALVYLERHFGIGQGTATLVVLGIGVSAILGAVVGGRVTDAMVHRGHVEARFVVPAVAFIVAGAMFVPGVAVGSIVVAIPFFLVTGFAIAAPNPGLDAARLDVMPARMWGRAEAVRSLLRAVFQSFAPLLFGLTSTLFGGRSEGFAASGIGKASAHAHATGLEPTFLVMLVMLVAAAVIVWRGRRFYAVDVAAAAATEQRFPAARSEAPPADSAAEGS
jgi:predicted MFS family arabinose efflux permease